MSALQLIPLDTWVIKHLPWPPWLRHDASQDLVFETAEEVLRHIAVDIPDRGAPIRNHFERVLVKQGPYREWSAARTLLKHAPQFRRYRTTAGSQRAHDAAIRIARRSASASDADLVDALRAEVLEHSVLIPTGQILFSGKAYPMPPSGTVRFETFLSTTLCPPVAAWHAHNHGYNQGTRAYVWAFRLAEEMRGIFVPQGSPEEYEVLFPPGASAVVERVERTGGLYDIITATLAAASDG